MSPREQLLPRSAMASMILAIEFDDEQGGSPVCERTRTECRLAGGDRRRSAMDSSWPNFKVREQNSCSAPAPVRRCDGAPLVQRHVQP